MVRRGIDERISKVLTLLLGNSLQQTACCPPLSKRPPWLSLVSANLLGSDEDSYNESYGELSGSVSVGLSVPRLMQEFDVSCKDSGKL